MPWLLLEVDESDGTIDHYSPEITLALNCDWDHVDRYTSSTSFSDTLDSLFSRTGKTVLLPKGAKMEHSKSSLSLEKFERFVVSADPSDYMLNNAEAARAAGRCMGVDLSKVDFSQFPGMKRRQNLIFEGLNRTILEDYAHHPTEIRSFLATVETRILKVQCGLYFNLTVIVEPRRSLPALPRNSPLRMISFFCPLILPLKNLMRKDQLKPSADICLPVYGQNAGLHRLPILARRDWPGTHRVRS